MKIGVLTALLSDLPLEKALDYVKEAGAEAVELGSGAYPGNAHCDPAALLASPAKLKAFTKAIESRGLTLSALSCHGNALHPNKTLAKEHHEAWQNTVLLAEKIGLDTVITFSGCPGDSDKSTAPNWVVAPWPEDHANVLEWQWKKKVIPYWKKEVKFAREHGVTKIALEMHPNFVVYNPETLLKLRAAAGDAIGANFDPSHLFWQGIDPAYAIRKLGECLWHFHAKDVKVDPYNSMLNGVLDTKSYTDEINRGWIFRTVGYGHGAEVWKHMISQLRLVGYDGVLSIEHEDSLMSPQEGLAKAIAFLKEAVIAEPPGEAYWA